MDTIKKFVIDIFTPKRANLDINYLLSTGSIFHFLTGLSVALFFTFSIHHMSVMFTLGVFIGFMVYLYLTLRYSRHYKQVHTKMLPNLNSISFTNTHFITKDSKIKCCGSNSDLCGWVYGVTSSYGLYTRDFIKQEMHVCIRYPYLILYIMSPQVDCSVLSSRIQLNRNAIEYKRVINLKYADIVLVPSNKTMTSRKYPISIISKRDMSPSDNVHWKIWKKNNSSWFYERLGNQKIFSWVYNSRLFSIFQCKTKQSTIQYINKSNRNPYKIFLCFLTSFDKYFWLRNLKDATLGKPVNPSMWEIIQPLIKYKHANKNQKSKTDDNDFTNFVQYFSKFMPHDWVMFKNKPVPLHVQPVYCESNLLWVNAFVARVWWNFVEKTTFHEAIMKFIRRKMQKLRKPGLIESIDIESFRMGQNTPIINEIDHPILDTTGLWFDVDFDYDGGFSFTIIVKVDIIKLRNRRNLYGAYSSDNLSGINTEKKVAVMDSLINSPPSSFIGLHTGNTPSMRSSNPNLLARGQSIFKRRRLADVSKTRKSLLTVRSSNFFQSMNFPIKDGQANRSNQTRRRKNTVREFIVTNKLQHKYSSSEYESDDIESDYDDDDDDENDEDDSFNPTEAEEGSKIKANCFRNLHKKLVGSKGSKKQKAPIGSYQRYMRNIVRRIKQHRYFKKLGNMTCFKRGLQYFGTKRILIDLCVHKFSGTLTVLYPNPPSDNIWFGLQPNPDFKLNIFPKIGQKKLNFNVILEWLQKKIMLEIKKVFILPNMQSFSMPN